MLDELPIASEGSPVAADTAATGKPVSADQPQSGGDSRLTAILQKKSAGEKLSAADRGYLGAVKRKGTPKTVAAVVNPNPLLTVAANPDNPLFDDVAENKAQADSPVAAAVDSALIHRTANALLSSLDLGTKIYVGYEARQAGADKQTVEEYKAAVALQPDNRQLMVENSEPVVMALCKIFGCTPDKLEGYLKGSGFLAGMVAHSIGVATAIKSIRESRKELDSKKTEAAK